MKLIYSNTFPIHSGSFGIVSRCIDKETNKEYAAKFVKCRPSQRKDIMNEIDILNEIYHQRIVNLISAFEFSRKIVLVMDLVGGGELFERLVDEEFISEMDATFFMKQILHAIQHLHERNILHLDLKVILYNYYMCTVCVRCKITHISTFFKSLLSITTNSKLLCPGYQGLGIPFSQMHLTNSEPFGYIPMHGLNYKRFISFVI